MTNTHNIRFVLKRGAPLSCPLWKKWNKKTAPKNGTVKRRDYPFSHKSLMQPTRISRSFTPFSCGRLPVGLRAAPCGALTNMIIINYQKMLTIISGYAARKLSGEKRLWNKCITERLRLKIRRRLCPRGNQVYFLRGSNNKIKTCFGCKSVSEFNY